MVAIMLLLVGALGWAVFQGRRDAEATAKRRMEKAMKARAEGKGAQFPHGPGHPQSSGPGAPSIGPEAPSSGPGAPSSGPYG